MPIPIKEKPPSSFLNEFSPPSSPMPPPNFPIPPTPPRTSLHSTASTSTSPLSSGARRFQSIHYANEELENFRDRQPSDVVPPEENTVVSPSQLAPPPRHAPPPRPPSANPWDTAVAQTMDGVPVEGDGIPRRPLVAPPSLRTSPLQGTSPISPGQPGRSPTLQRRPIASPSGIQTGNTDAYPYDEAEWRRLTNQHYGYSTTSPHSSPLHVNTKLAPFPEGAPHENGNQTEILPRAANTPNHGHQVSLESGSTPHDPQRDTFGATSQRRSRTDSVAESILDPYLSNVKISDHSHETASITGRPPVTPSHAVDDGLIPVEQDRQPAPPRPALSRQECSIGSNSSFYLCKGFCSGAEEVIVGGLGIKKTRRPVVSIPGRIEVGTLLTSDRDSRAQQL